LHADEHKLTEKWLILGARHEPAFVQTSGTSITTAAMSKADAVPDTIDAVSCCAKYRLATASLQCPRFITTSMH
jgi:hypothetical protein